MQNLKNIIPKITEELNLFITKLQYKAPEKDFSFDVDETQMHWIVKWKSTKYYRESFEIEIWSDNNRYTLRGEHVIDNMLNQINEPYLLYEDKSSIELISKMDEIVQAFKISVVEINDIN